MLLDRVLVGSINYNYLYSEYIDLLYLILLLFTGVAPMKRGFATCPWLVSDRRRRRAGIDRDESAARVVRSELARPTLRFGLIDGPRRRLSRTRDTAYRSTAPVTRANNC